MNALLMDPKDNVVTMLEEVPAGGVVSYQCGEDLLELTALETIPYCHKILLNDIQPGDPVIKYGESIGVTDAGLSRGQLIDHRHLFSVPRDYASEMLLKTEGE